MKMMFIFDNFINLALENEINMFYFKEIMKMMFIFDNFINLALENEINMFYFKDTMNKLCNLADSSIILFRKKMYILDIIKIPHGNNNNKFLFFFARIFYYSHLARLNKYIFLTANIFFCMQDRSSLVKKPYYNFFITPKMYFVSKIHFQCIFLRCKFSIFKRIKISSFILIDFAIILIILGKLTDIVTLGKSAAVPTANRWCIMRRLNKATPYKKSINPETDNLKQRPEEELINEKLDDMLKDAVMSEKTINNFTTIDDLEQLSDSDTSGCNHLLVCRDLEPITGTPDCEVHSTITTKGVAYIRNKDGAIVGIRNITEFFSDYSLTTGQKRAQFLWTLDRPLIASKSMLKAEEKGTEAIYDNPHILAHVEDHYRWLVKRGFICPVNTSVGLYNKKKKEDITDTHDT